MKCVKYHEDGKIKRIKDEQAHELVRSGKADYCPKHVWKQERNRK